MSEPIVIGFEAKAGNIAIDPRQLYVTNRSTHSIGWTPPFDEFWSNDSDCLCL